MRQWFSMKADDVGAEILIYDEIGKSFWGEETVGAKKFLDDLSALGDVKNITLRINSPGGDVFDGVAIHNALKTHGAKVTAHIDGIAASIASYIAMAADRIVMPSNAFMLIHNASGFVFGHADDMRSVAADLDRVDKSIVATYASRSKTSQAKIREIMKEDRLMDAREAKELGLADETVKDVKMAANFSLRLLPKAAAERFMAETGAGQGLPPPTATATEHPEGQPPDPPDATPDPPPNPPPQPTPTPQPPAPPQQPTRQPDPPAPEPVPDRPRQVDHEYIRAVTELCTLASALDKVGAFLLSEKPIEDIRKELLALRASGTEILPQHPIAATHAQKPAVAWDKITSKLNARSARKES